MPNARRLELTIRQQKMIVSALEGYADRVDCSPSEYREITDLIRLIHEATALLIEYAPRPS